MSGETPPKKTALDEAVRILAALSPAVFLAAVTLPGSFDPLEPFDSAPPLVWALLFVSVASAALVAIPGTPSDRRLALGAGWLAGVIVAFSIADVALIRETRSALIPVAFAAVSCIVAARNILDPSRRHALALIPAVGFTVVSGDIGRLTSLTPVETLRAAMVAAPGWGEASLGHLLARAAVHQFAAPGYEARLRVFESKIADLSTANAFPPEWSDDAHLIDSWLLVKISASPALDATPAASDELLRRAASERLAFAADPLASAEPFTASGVLYRDALNLADDLPNANVALRLRIATAWSALQLYSTRVNDPARERESIALIRTLFEANQLDRTHDVYLETWSEELRRDLESGDALKTLALLDGLQKEPFPTDRLKKLLSDEAAEIRANPDHGYAPILLYLAAKQVAGRGEDPRKFLDPILQKYGDSPVAPRAKLLLESLAKSPTS